MTKRDEIRLTCIPTRIMGYNCRSRIEAKWLLFFHLMEIKFEYEPEGFILSDGTKYLPDLYLPEPGFFGEIKATWVDHNEERKCRLLAGDSGRDVLFLIGPPDFKPYRAATWMSGEYRTINFCLDIHGRGEKAWINDRRLYSDPGDMPEDEFSGRYREAVCAARNARFESAA